MMVRNYQYPTAVYREKRSAHYRRRVDTHTTVSMDEKVLQLRERLGDVGEEIAPGLVFLELNFQTMETMRGTAV